MISRWWIGNAPLHYQIRCPVLRQTVSVRAATRCSQPKKEGTRERCGGKSDLGRTRGLHQIENDLITQRSERLGGPTETPETRMPNSLGGGLWVRSSGPHKIGRCTGDHVFSSHGPRPSPHRISTLNHSSLRGPIPVGPTQSLFPPRVVPRLSERDHGSRF